MEIEDPTRQRENYSYKGKKDEETTQLKHTNSSQRFYQTLFKWRDSRLGKYHIDSRKWGWYTADDHNYLMIMRKAETDGNRS
jgi:hypothetical protein